MNQSKNNVELKDKDNWYLKNKEKIKIILLCISLLILIISVIRLPYVGQFIDSTVFSFLFGYSKYILYSYLFLIILMKLFRVKKKIFYSKRILLFVLFLTFFTSMILGGLALLINDRKDININYYINEVWLKYIWSYNFKNYPYFGNGNFIDGGFIGTSLASISGIFLIIISAILILLVFLILFKSVRINLVKLFFKIKEKVFKNTNYYQSFKFSFHSTKQHLLDFQKQSHFNLDDKYKLNEINLSLINKTLTNFLRNNNIIFSEIIEDEDEEYFYLYFNLDDEQYEKFSETKSMLSIVFGDLEYSMINTDGKISFKFEKLSKKINDILSSYLTININKDLQYAVCMNQDHKPIYLKFDELNSIGIACRNKKNVYSYINSLIAHISINYKISGAKISILSPLSVHEKVLLTQNTSKEVLDDLNKVNLFISNIYKSIKEIDEIYNNKKVYNFLDVMKNNKSLTYRIIIIDNISTLIQSDKNLFNRILHLINNSSKYGLLFLIIDNSSDAISFREINYQVKLGFDMSHELSKELFGSLGSKKLVADNYALFSIESKNEMFKVLIPRMNNNELIFVQNKLISILTNYKL